MFENDAIHSFQRSSARRTKATGMTNATKQSKDDFIMDTNNSSIVSKRSVEKLYWTGEPEYFRHFVTKFKRRSPLINRGYWLRMRAVEHTVEEFLKVPDGKKKLVVNLGCGYDPLPWLFLGKRPHLCDNATFVDVDYPQLMKKKMQTIQQCATLKRDLKELEFLSANDGVLCRSEKYVAIGCDLRNLEFLRYVMANQLSAESCSVAILFVAEVSIAYMDLEGSQAVMQWASAYDDVRFCLLEQHLPDGKDNPFAQTMLKHFEKLRTPLRQIGTMEDMRNRFADAGWPRSQIDIRSLWSLWSDDQFLTPEQRVALDVVEPFDEWEELAMFASHYFLLVASKGASTETHPTTASNFNNAEISRGVPLKCEEQAKVSCQRRFACVLPGRINEHGFGLHGGLGTQERLSSVDLLGLTDYVSENKGPPLLTGIVGHTITLLGESGDCLMVGGRLSPGKAITESWVRLDDVWKPVHPLPEGRYRHCAARVVYEDQQAVLISGGKKGNGEVAAEFLLWREDRGWIELKCLSDQSPSSFGAFMTVDSNMSSGSIIGGMYKGKISDQAWSWELQPDGIMFRDVSDQYRQRLGVSSRLLWRFGAQLEQWTNNVGDRETILVGGIGVDGSFGRDTEVLNLSRGCTHPIEGSRPMFIGHSIYDRLCVGGGATCFSFGTYWSHAAVFRFLDEQMPSSEWRSVISKPPKEQHTHGETRASISGQSKVLIEQVSLTGKVQFEKIQASRRPVVFKKCDLGPCVSKWSAEYLKSALSSRKVVVHAAREAAMNFQNKNFNYETRNFNDFIDDIEQGELLYMRALSTESPSEQPTSLNEDFPEIAQDFVLPTQLQYAQQNVHSSPLRISGPTTMWLHYDVMSNVLCQIRGSKRLLLFPPSNVSRLGFEAGASSSSLNAFEQDIHGCQAHEALLEPGDILFIPAFWLHTAKPEDKVSIAVNIFFKDLQTGYAAGRDVYGNRDLAAYERGRKELAKLRQTFAGLPPEVSRFYLERLGNELMEIAQQMKI